jgi:hypothetical protein
LGSPVRALSDTNVVKAYGLCYLFRFPKYPANEIGIVLHDKLLHLLSGLPLIDEYDLINVEIRILSLSDV